MKTQLRFHNKLMHITLSENAVIQSEELSSPLIIEIQIYFSCLLGKRLAFYTEDALDNAWQVEPALFSTMLNDSQQLSNNLHLRFNTVMTKACPVSDYVGPPPVTDFTIKNQKPYVPEWLNINFKKNIWSGEYGWASSNARNKNTKQVRAPAITSQQNQRANLLKKPASDKVLITR